MYVKQFDYSKRSILIEKHFEMKSTVKYNLSRTLMGNKLAYHSDVAGASPIGAAPTTPSILT